MISYFKVLNLHLSRTVLGIVVVGAVVVVFEGRLIEYGVKAFVVVEGRLIEYGEKGCCCCCSWFCCLNGLLIRDFKVRA